MKKERKIELADWVVDTSLAFGASVNTAYKVAALFIEALENEEAENGTLSERRNPEA